MNLRYFEEWANLLSQLRQGRRSDIDAAIQMAGASFLPNRFFDMTKGNLENIVSKWWDLEQKSWQETPRKNGEVDIKKMCDELEALVDFELHAIEKDVEYVKQKISWTEQDVLSEQNNLLSYAEDLKEEQSEKIESLKIESAKKDAGKPDMPITTQKMATGGSSGSGVGIFFMFLFGFMLGGGLGVYFWNLSKQVKAEYTEQIDKLKIEHRAVLDRLVVFSDVFSKLANGKVRTLPQIESAMRPIKARYESERRKVESSAMKKKEASLKKMAPGDRLDFALSEIEQEKEDLLESIQNREETELEPIRKERETLINMMGDSQEP